MNCKYIENIIITNYIKIIEKIYKVLYNVKRKLFMLRMTLIFLKLFTNILQGGRVNVKSVCTSGTCTSLIS